MALGPDGLITVVGDVDTITDTKANGSLTVSLSDKLVAGGKTYAPIDQVVQLNPNDGTFAIKLPPTGTSGVTYKFSLVVYAYVGGQREHYEESFNTVLDAADANAQGVIQYKDLAPVATPGVPSTFLTRTAADTRYALKGEIPTLPSNVVTSDNIGEFLEPVDLSTYATKQNVTDAIGSVDLTAYATKQYVTGAVGSVDLSAVQTAAANAQAAATQATGALASKADGRPAGLFPFNLRMTERRTKAVNIISVGSSTVRGNQLANIRNRFPNTLGAMMHAGYNPAGVVGGRFSIADEESWTIAGGTKVSTATGFNLHSLALTAGMSMTQVFDLTTGFTVYFAQGAGAGAFTVSIDNGAAVTVTPSTAAAAGTFDGAWKSPVLLRGEHTLRITAVGAVSIDGVYAYDGDETLGVRSYVAGLAGGTVGDFVGTPGLTFRQRVAQIQPALVVLCWGSNDWKDGTPVPTFKTRLETLIGEIQTAVGAGTPVTFLLIAQAQRLLNQGSGDYAPYIAAISEVAAAQPSSRVYVDAASQFPTSVAGDIYTLVGPDGIHPSDRGQTLISDLIQRALWIPSAAAGSEFPPPTATPTPPGPVTGLAAGTATSSSVALTWAGATGATSFAPEVKKSTDTAWTRRTAVSTLSANVGGLTAETGYDFRVVALNQYGEAAASAAVTKSTIAAPVVTYDYKADSALLADYDANTLADNTTNLASWSSTGGTWPALTQPTTSRTPGVGTAAQGVNGRKVAFFDGGDFVGVAPTGTAPTAFTIVTVFRPDAIGANQRLYGNGASTTTFANSAVLADGTMNISVPGGSLVSTKKVTAGTYSILGGVYAGASSALYLDGKTAHVSGTLPSDATTVLANLRLAASSTPSIFFTGAIAEVIVIGRALTASEMSSVIGVLADRYALPVAA